MKRSQRISKLDASAFLSAILLLFVCILFITYYQQSFMMNLENNLMLLKYLNN